ncbi:MAG: glycosyltransferase family 4 protein [Candidatus Korarchaeota archaeon]|nr:glycosyltransferase family 4 protein [Candidatus Korarchaeota archaeon]
MGSGVVRVLWFNWRDLRNPESGGAEIYTHNIAKRLVRRGIEVTLFTSNFSGGSELERIDGVEIIRRGKGLSVFKEAKKFCERHHGEYDVIVDEINTRPFMVVKRVGESRTLALIHQLAREFWFYETPLPLAVIGYAFLERWWLRRYRGVTTITVSRSTEEDLRNLGFRDIRIVLNGVNVDPLDSVPKKSDFPTVIYVGRMKRAKKPEDAIKAFLIVRRRLKDIRLWMVGEGYLRRDLERRYGRIVKFFGYLPSREKDLLVRRSWVILVPGVREGWGQVITDANALGTPAIGYDIKGLRDSIKHGYNGFLVSPKPEAMARVLERVLVDEELREELSRNALSWARQFNWDRSALEFESIVREIAERKQ